MPGAQPCGATAGVATRSNDATRQMGDDMTAQAWWVVALIAVAVAGLIGFFAGRQWSGARKRVEELETELSGQKAAMDQYKREVDTHFDKTATLFVSMAGSYKELFEHLSSGYRKLSAGSERDLFRDRVAALLLDGSKGNGGDERAVLEHGTDGPTSQDEVAAGAADKIPSPAGEPPAADKEESEPVLEAKPELDGPEPDAKPEPDGSEPEAGQAVERERKPAGNGETDEIAAGGGDTAGARAAASAGDGNGDARPARGSDDEAGEKEEGDGDDRARRAEPSAPREESPRPPRDY